MHICHVTLDHTPYDDRIYYRELWSFIHWAKQITLVAKEVPEPTLIYPEITLEHFPAVKVLKRLPYIRNILLKLQPDVLHLHEPELLLIVPALRRHTDAAIIYDMHEPLPEVIREFSRAPLFKRYLLSYILGAIERSALSYTDGVVHTSLPLFNSYHTANTNSALIYNFPRLDLFPPKPHSEPEEFTVLYQGQIAPARGILELVDGFNHFYQKEHRGRLRILGYIHPVEFESVLEQRIRHYNLSGVVTLEQEIPHTEMADVLANVSVGMMALLPTNAFRKSVQGKTFEYMSAGLPSIAGNYPSAHQFIGKTHAGIVLKNSDPETISDAFSQLANNPGQRRRMGQNAQNAVRNTYHWARMAKELRHFYMQILTSRRGELSRVRWHHLAE